MADDPEEAHVFVAVRTSSGKAFAVAVLAGGKGVTNLHRVAVDEGTVQEAATNVLREVVGLRADSPTAISMHSPMEFSDEAKPDDFFRQVGGVFDGFFPKGIGSA